MRIVFAGTPDFSVPALQALIASEHEVIAVYTQPDRPAGRGRKLTPSPVKQAALDAGLGVEQPETLKTDDTIDTLSALEPDVMVVVAYGLILPQRVLDIPRLGCVNIHASLLPRWRGAAPIQRAIESGDSETGVCFMQMDKGLDTGDVLARASTPIAPDDTAATLHDRLSALGGRDLVKTLNALNAGTLMPEPQNDALATYAAKLTKAEARLDWTRPAIDLARQVRAFNPWPVSHTALDGTALRVHDAKALDVAISEPPGSVLDLADSDAIAVSTGYGVLALTEVQWAGKRRMSAADALAGKPLSGLRFEAVGDAA